MRDSRISVSLPTPALAAAVADLDLADRVESIAWDLTTPSPSAHIDLVVLPYQQDPRRAANLGATATQLVQAQTIGYEDVLANLPPGHTVANARSVHEASTAELALGLALASLRRFPEYTLAAQGGRWQQLPGQSLADRTIALVGYGGVGQAIEQRLNGFEARVLRFARTARPGGPDGAGRVREISDLAGLLPEIDVVILTVPLTGETRHLVDDAFLAAMRPGALLVNVARGPVVDTDALVRALEAGHVRAALDVTDPEPLPSGHPLWSLEGALITPHVGGASSAMHPRMVALIERQVRALLNGETPENIVASS
ncbi:2-hydroxyacid dehydrogenase [Pseudoclavibacter terrae]|uniref:2-hydroxyacid dehydrogenase n=1 Tax=Pseudoclavibacter terrae TaxID=1530195 RepID=A0A7J5B1X5_9MICO|nr:2-hydroxyacid dehydrogenase [Pseudoclavibacter terrae]KAB1637880.1 2-hydroxyacid dehydrogenase [Pseudoclavibacter terrae]